MHNIILIKLICGMIEITPELICTLRCWAVANDLQVQEGAEPAPARILCVLCSFQEFMKPRTFSNRQARSV